MILNLQTSPQRCVRSFDKRTWILIRVVTAAITMRIGHEQSEVTGDANSSAPNDGVTLDSTGTSGAGKFPFGTWWKGDLWFSASGPGQAVLINTGEYDNEQA